MEVTDFIKTPDHWERFPDVTGKNLVIFLRKRDGLQLTTSIKHDEGKDYIYASIAKISFYNPSLSNEEWVNYIEQNVETILNDFFGNRKFNLTLRDENWVGFHFSHALEDYKWN